MSENNDKAMSKLSVSGDLPITEVIKRWFNAGSISVEGIYVPRKQCQRALIAFNQWLTENDAEGWKETVKEMQRIGSWQIDLLTTKLRESAFNAHMVSVALEDQGNFKAQFRHVPDFDLCQHPDCVGAKDAIKEVQG